jgi:hypothetical protein
VEATEAKVMSVEVNMMMVQKNVVETVDALDVDETTIVGGWRHSLYNSQTRH